MENRSSAIIKTSIIGILANILLAAFKVIVGLVANSIAIITDGINNLSDALSSLITIISTKLAVKRPDKKHPLGYGRIEHLSAMIISVIVLYAGITSLVESVKKIISPEVSEYTTLTFLILIVGIVVKLVLSMYVQKQGKKYDSDALTASGLDARNDAVLSASVLLSAVLYYFSNISIEAYVGTLLSVIIVKSGLDMMKDTLSTILGERIDLNFSKEIKRAIAEDKAVEGAYDLVLHNYGPDRLIGSVHVEVDESLTAKEIDAMERRIQKNIFLKYGVILEGISIYSTVTKDPEVLAIKNAVGEIVMSYPTVLQYHGFYCSPKEKEMSLDIIIDYNNADREHLFTEILQDVQSHYPEYHIQMNLDGDISD